MDIRDMFLNSCKISNGGINRLHYILSNNIFIKKKTAKLSKVNLCRMYLSGILSYETMDDKFTSQMIISKIKPSVN